MSNGLALRRSATNGLAKWVGWWQSARAKRVASCVDAPGLVVHSALASDENI